MICKDVENTFLCCSSSFTCKSHKKIVTVTNNKNMNIHKETKKPSPHATLEWLSHTQSRAFRFLTRTEIHGVHRSISWYISFPLPVTQITAPSISILCTFRNNLRLLPAACPLCRSPSSSALFVPRRFWTTSNVYISDRDERRVWGFARYIEFVMTSIERERNAYHI